MGERATYLPFAGLTAATFWVAWITVVFSGDIVVFSSVSAFRTTSFVLIWSTFGMGMTMVAGGCLPKAAWRSITSTRMMLACGFVCMASTIIIGFEGLVPHPLFLFAALCAGASLGCILIRCSIVFAETDPKTAALFAGSCGLSGTFIYCLFSLVAQFHSSLIVLFMSALLPLFAAFACLLETDNESIASMLQDEASETLTGAFWRVVAFIVVISFTLSVIRGFYPQRIDLIQFAGSRADAALMLALFFLFYIAVVIKRNYDYSFGRLFYWLFMLAVAVMVPAVALGAFSSFSGSLATLSKGMLFLAAWNFLSLWSYKTGMSPVRVFGFGFGASMIASSLGYATGDFMGEMISLNYSALFESFILLVCVLLAVLLLRVGDLQMMLTPSSAMISSVELPYTSPAVSRENVLYSTEALEEEQEQPSYSDDQDAAVDTDESFDDTSHNKPGRFMLRCNLIAEEYGLTSREADVFRLLAKHMEAKAIADELCVSFNTARTHIRHIYAKLEVHNRRELDELVDSFNVD